MKVQQMEVKVESKSADNVFVHLHIAVQYQIKPDAVYDAVYKVAEPKDLIRAYITNVVRSAVPTITLDDIFLQKNHIADAVKEELEKVMHNNGYQIVGVLVVDIDPAAEVKRAMNEINTQERLRVAALARAEAEKMTLIKAAEADAESKHLSGVGLANQRKAIVNGLSISIKEFADSIHGTSPKDVMDLVMMNQYFDTLKELAHNSRNTTIFIPHNPASMHELQAQISGGFMSQALSSSSPAPGPSTSRDTHLHRN